MTKLETFAPSAVSPRFLIPFVGLMLGLNAFANDILLPAFFLISAELEAPIEIPEIASPEEERIRVGYILGIALV